MKTIPAAVLQFLLPIFLWIYLFKPFFWGQAVIFSENFSIYAIVKYYLDNLRLGIFPLWNPYLLLGSVNDISLNNIGAFNPIWLVILLLNSLGIDFYHSYLYVIVFYFFLGQVGFYFFLKTFLKNSLAIYCGFLIMLFSSLSFPLFVQVNMMLDYVPGIWCFYFLIRFFQLHEKKYFLGIIFCAMIIVSTYLPAYFITVFVLFYGLYLLFFPGRSILQIKKSMVFCRKNLIWLLVGLFAISIALFPGIKSYQAISSKEVIVPFRHKIAKDVYDKGLELAYEHMIDAGISSRMAFDDLFSNLDQIIYGNDGFFYVSIFCYIIIFLGMFVPYDRRMIIAALFSLFIFLLMLTNVSPFHKFLFNHIPFFRFFRNLHFLMPFLLSGFISFVCLQFEYILNQKGKIFPKVIFNLLWVIVVHGGIAVFLFTRENIIPSSYWAVGMSFLFFIVYFYLPQKGLLKYSGVILIACILIQPIEVFSKFNRKPEQYGVKILKESLAVGPVKPGFHWNRPVEVARDHQSDVNAWMEPQYYFYRYQMTMSDSPGFFMPFPYGFPTYWSYYFQEKTPKDIFRGYAKNKFYLYDNVRAASKTDSNWPEQIASIKENLNLAIIVSDDADLGDLTRQPVPVPRHAEIISPDDGRFKIRNFTVNSLEIETDFPKQKFLVYTDSYVSAWKAFVNGRETPVYRTNGAFKGIVLPGGKNKVLLAYKIMGGQFTFFLIFGVFVSLFIVLILSFLPKSGKNTNRRSYG